MKRYYDEDICCKAQQLLEKHHCKMVLNDKVTKITKLENEKLEIELEKQKLVQDAIVMCIGFKPNTAFVDLTKLENQRGAFVVNQHAMTSMKNVFAVGDCAMSNTTQGPMYAPLATNAIKQAIAAASYLVGKPINLYDYVLTSQLKIFGESFGQCGENSKNLKSITLDEYVLPEFMKENEKVLLRVYYEGNLIKGAQMYGGHSVGDLVQIVSLVIQHKITFEQLLLGDFAFNPWFGKPQHVLQRIAMKVLFNTDAEKFE